jgi:hypothetical protein
MCRLGAVLVNKFELSSYLRQSYNHTVESEKASVYLEICYIPSKVHTTRCSITWFLIEDYGYA